MHTQLRKLTLALAAVVTLGASHPSAAQDSDPGYAALKGKKIIYIPIAMNYDITQAWYAGMKREADRFGYEIVVRDPNWDTNAAVQAFQAAVREKPDLIVTLPPDTTSLSRLVKRAQEAGIKVIEIQQITSSAPDVFVGSDWTSIGRANANAVAKACGQGSGKSGKIAVVTGPTTAPASINWVNGVTEVLKDRKDITIVSTQAAEWDAAKSHAIVSTALQQNADLCGVLDVWDGDATGSVSAIREAGKSESIFLATAGGGEKAACDAISSGAYSSYVSFDAATQASYLNAIIKLRLQNKEAAGSAVSVVYTPEKLYTKDSLLPNSCWTIDALNKSGG